jgi:hypothetical protein
MYGSFLQIVITYDNLVITYDNYCGEDDEESHTGRS